MKRLIGILQFLTRIPFPMDLGIDEDFHKSIIYFPLVGWILGMIYYGVAHVSLLLFDHKISAIVTLLAMLILTGALHIDGVGDTFDGLYSYRSKERILEIMKDSRLGTNGLLAIVFLLLFKLVFIEALLQRGYLWGLIVMPIYGRMASMWSCYRTKTPRLSGMGNIFIGKISTKRLLMAISYGILLICGIIYLWGADLKSIFVNHFICFMMLGIGIRLWIRSIYKRIDGITGDILGAICEMTELVYLISVYFL